MRLTRIRLEGRIKLSLGDCAERFEELVQQYLAARAAFHQVSLQIGSESAKLEAESWGGGLRAETRAGSLTPCTSKGNDSESFQTSQQGRGEPNADRFDVPASQAIDRRALSPEVKAASKAVFPSMPNDRQVTNSFILAHLEDTQRKGQVRARFSFFSASGAAPSSPHFTPCRLSCACCWWQRQSNSITEFDALPQSC